MPLSQEIKNYIERARGHLDLSNLGLLDDDLVELAEILKSRSDIISVDLQSNMGKRAGAIAMFSSPHIKKLNFSSNNTVDEAFITFIKLLKEGKTSLEFLDVSRNALTDESIKELDAVKMEGKIDKTKFVLEPNTKISEELLDRFYDRIISHEMKQFSEQLETKTVDISPSYANLLKSHKGRLEQHSPERPSVTMFSSSTTYQSIKRGKEENEQAEQSEESDAIARLTAVIEASPTLSAIIRRAPSNIFGKLIENYEKDRTSTPPIKVP